MIELTGLSEFTIRGWENRYAAFRPRRTLTGRREYSKNDVERALLLRELLKRGHKIGQIATLNHQSLSTLFEGVEHDNSSADSQSLKAASEDVTKVLELLALQRWEDLETHIKRVRAPSPTRLVQDFFLPALKALASQVEHRLISVAQEHVFSAFLKERIYSELAQLERKRPARQRLSSSRFVLATPEGDYHELGLLLAHLLLRSRGFTSLYIGANTPAQELAETALRFKASHLLVVSTVSRRGGARHDVLSFISALQKKLGRQARILLAGSQALATAHDAGSAVQTFADFEAFENFLSSLSLTRRMSESSR